jgi:hypothetical protein
MRSRRLCCDAMSAAMGEKQKEIDKCSLQLASAVREKAPI